QRPERRRAHPHPDDRQADQQAGDRRPAHRVRRRRRRAADRREERQRAAHYAPPTASVRPATTSNTSSAIAATDWLSTPTASTKRRPLSVKGWTLIPTSSDTT